jgi:hypothetical protein
VAAGEIFVDYGVAGDDRTPSICGSKPAAASLTILSARDEFGTPVCGRYLDGRR